jgi:hypothetical protein
MLTVVIIPDIFTPSFPNPALISTTSTHHRYRFSEDHLGMTLTASPRCVVECCMLSLFQVFWPPSPHRTLRLAQERLRPMGNDWQTAQGQVTEQFSTIYIISIISQHRQSYNKTVFGGSAEATRHFRGQHHQSLNHTVFGCPVEATCYFRERVVIISWILRIWNYLCE